MKQLRGTPLKRFLRDWRRTHTYESEIIILLDSVTYPVNVGSIFRIADAVGVNEVVLCGATPVPPHPTITKVGRNKHQNVAWRYEEVASEVLDTLHQAGYQNVAIEITDQAEPYYEFSAPSRTCLVLGNEDHGVTRASLAHCDAAVFVPMYGKGRSLNVHISAAVILYHLAHTSSFNSTKSL